VVVLVFIIHITPSCGLLTYLRRFSIDYLGSSLIQKLNFHSLDDRTRNDLLERQF